jgi:hypothetical protein
MTSLIARLPGLSPGISDWATASGSAPPCLDAADTNDDGAVDIGDAIAVLSHLFAGAGPLPDPFGECGVDPTVDELGCASYELCEGQ